MTDQGNHSGIYRELSRQAHQFNYLLATMRLYVQLGLRKNNLPEDLKENLGIMLDLLSESKELIGDMHTREQSLFKRFATLEEGFYIVSLDGHMLDCNESFRKILGYNNGEELAGMQPSFLWHDPQELEQFIHILNSEGIIRDMQVSLNKADGQKIVINTNAFLLTKGNGQRNYFVYTVSV